MADDLTPATRDLYERDYLAWTDQQAALLRARGANALDYDNLAEEIEDLGKSELRACASQIDNIIEHLLKVEFGGQTRPQGHWRKEVREFRRQLARTVTPTIRNRLEPLLVETFEDVLAGLVEDGIVTDPAAVRGARPQGYVWEQIRDPDWYPPLSD